MSFLRSAWYVAGWSGDLGTAPRRIRVLGEWIALFRLADGTAAAIGDRCPHRFASLGDGKLVGDSLQCPYHGLRFDRDGRCVHNPHGDGSVPAGSGVRSYPLVERHGALWVWTGEPGRADPAAIPDFARFDDPALAVSRGYLKVTAPYELVTDNLLDLSHAAFLHPFLASPDAADRTRTGVRQESNTVWSQLWIEREPVTPLFRLVWDHPDDQAEMRSHMRWTAPSSLYLDVGMTPDGIDPDDSPALPSAHLLTPETEGSTHYFWMVGRNRGQADAAIGERIHAGIARAFAEEDEPMIARVAENMDGADFWSLRPMILAGDAAAVRARRILAQMIRAEGATPATPDATRIPAIEGTQHGHHRN